MSSVVPAVVDGSVACPVDVDGVDEVTGSVGIVVGSVGLVSSDPDIGSAEVPSLAPAVSSPTGPAGRGTLNGQPAAVTSVSAAKTR
ncbi:hypothetical protein [Nannocystis radixulma]|uniref:Uncharacterized protein n=1 Tax=Nannocystis radixulma TaxID=2995305 RepID=A0ABT5BS09_9BACT|nr:hypothetical protein [Nannocystis radixulma]MDC0675772.1 hypothetical protein [Nannocystis radixulma]